MKCPVRKCPVQRACGACQLLSTPYDKQLVTKQHAMEQLFAPFITPSTHIHSIAGMDEPYYYRNKVTSPFAPGKKLNDSQAHGSPRKKQGAKKPHHRTPHTTSRRDILCGMYATGTHRIIPTNECLIENAEAKRIILAIRSLMLRYGMEPYNEDTGTGFMRHAVVRVGHTTGEILVTLVTNGKTFTGSKNFCRELVKRIPAITTIVQNINTRQTNVILGEEENTLYGPGFILDSLCGLSFRISAHSFYQVNSTQTEVLYRRALEMARLTGTETLLDAYCGTGTIGLVAAKGLPTPAAHVIGVDKVSSAIKDARENARHNGITNATFTTGDAGNFMRDYARRHESIDVVLMDPPRAGASEDFLRAACTLKPQRIVYISCNPTTQARDVRFLTSQGYHLDELQPVDMFPHTNHVENIVSLSYAKRTNLRLPT